MLWVPTKNFCVDTRSLLHIASLMKLKALAEQAIVFLGAWL